MAVGHDACCDAQLPLPLRAPPQPITGINTEVRMTGDAAGYRFEPAAITIKKQVRDQVHRRLGFPHNVAADPASFQTTLRPLLSAKANQMAR